MHSLSSRSSMLTIQLRFVFNFIFCPISYGRLVVRGISFRGVLYIFIKYKDNFYSFDSRSQFYVLAQSRLKMGEQRSYAKQKSTTHFREHFLAL